MGGMEHWTLPQIGRQHSIDVDGTRWEIRPSFDAVLLVAAAADEAGAVSGQELTNAQLAVVKRACVDHMLTPEQRDAFGAWPAERQGLMAEKLFLIWNEIRSGIQYGNPDDPTPVDTPDPTASPSA